MRFFGITIGDSLQGLKKNADIKGLETLGQRLEYLLEHKNKSQTELAVMIGTKPQTIQAICSKGIKKSRYTPMIAKALNVNPVWLETGNGTMVCTDQMLGDQINVPVFFPSSLKEYFNGSLLEQDYKILQLSFNGVVEFSEEYFALLISENDSHLGFVEDSLLIFSKKIEPKDNHYYLYLDQNDDFQIKKLKYRNKHYEFQTSITSYIVPDKSVLASLLELRISYQGD